MTNGTNGINEYRPVVGTNEIEEIRMLAGKLEGRKMLNVNSTPEGGGVAEILARLVPLLKSLGIDATWDVIKGGDDFFNVTKIFHNGLHGGKVKLTSKMFEIFESYNDLNCSLFDKESDFYIIHDPQPVGLIKMRENFQGHWVWRCHIDVSTPNKRIWDFLQDYIVGYDASLFSMPQFSRRLPIPQFLVTPSIDPLSDKNRELDKKYISSVLEKYNIDPERPYITQISRFDRLKDPLGVIQAYKLVKKKKDCQLVLAGGGAPDDPEGAQVLEEVNEAAEGDDDVKILELPPFSDLEINALQRASTIVLQKSLKEGFGMTVTEGLWKGRPVIGGAVGGIKSQVINGVTGYLVYSVEGCAKRISELLDNPELGDRLGRNGKEMVRSRFLLTRHVKNYLLLMLGMKSTLNPLFTDQRVITVK